MSEATTSVIELSEVRQHYQVGGGLLRRNTGIVKAVDGISLSIPEGTTYGLVGESGSGKTTTARMILMVESPTEGQVKYMGQSLSDFSNSERRAFQSSIAAVFQDPWSSLNPRMKVGSIVSEPLTTHQDVSKSERNDRITELLEVVGLRANHAERYPHEFSGGQRQRIAIARALSTQPKLIVLDEPVSALDVSIRAQILNLLKKLQKNQNLSYLLIAHDLAAVRYMCHKVGVLYLGQLVEEGSSQQVFAEPKHPYTRALISASLPSHPKDQREEIVLEGEIPSPLNPPNGCYFHTRCPNVMDKCSQETPEYLEVIPGHQVSCHLYP